MSNKGKLHRVGYNMIAGLAYQVITLIIGFILPRLVLVYYGSDVNGELNAIRQMFAYLYLLEAGVGLATTQALYKPVAEDDHRSISAILSATNQHYRRTGLIYALIVVAVGVFYPMVADFSLSRGTVLLYTVLFGLPSVVSFWVQGKYRMLLEVDGRNYVISTFNIISQIISGAAKIVTLMLTKDIIVMQAVFCVCSLICVPPMMIYIRRHYPWLNMHETPNFKAISQKNAVLVHQLSSVIFNNTDTILLSLFGNFKLVSIYSVYGMFFNKLSDLMDLIINSISFKMGQVFHTERGRFSKAFRSYETLYSIITTLCYTAAALFLLPVIRIYTSGITDANYISSALIVMFALKSLLGNGKNPYHQIVQFAGEFERTRWHAIVEMLLNLGITLATINTWGIYGCLAGTIAALLFRWIAVSVYSLKGVLNESMKPHIIKWLCNLGVFTAAILVVGISSRPDMSLIQIILIAILHMIWISALCIAVNYFIDRDAFRNVRSLILRKRGKGQERAA